MFTYISLGECWLLNMRTLYCKNIPKETNEQILGSSMVITWLVDVLSTQILHRMGPEVNNLWLTLIMGNTMTFIILVCIIFTKVVI